MKLYSAGGSSIPTPQYFPSQVKAKAFATSVMDELKAGGHGGQVNVEAVIIDKPDLTTICSLASGGAWASSRAVVWEKDWQRETFIDAGIADAIEDDAPVCGSDIPFEYDANELQPASND